MKADKEGTKAIIGKFTRLTDPEGLERTYRNYTSVLLDVPYADPAGIKTLLDDMAPKNPKAAAADPKVSSMRVSCRKWKRRDSSKAAEATSSWQ